jgi:hypothetical protein
MESKALKIIIGLFVMLILAVGMYMIFFAPKDVANLTLQVNPAINLTLDKRNTVIKVEGLDANGELLLEELVVTGKEVSEALRVITEALQRAGFLGEGRRILIALSPIEDRIEQAELAALTGVINQALREYVVEVGLAVEITTVVFTAELADAVRVAGLFPADYVDFVIEAGSPLALQTVALQKELGVDPTLFKEEFGTITSAMIDMMDAGITPDNSLAILRGSLVADPTLEELTTITAAMIDLVVDEGLTKEEALARIQAAIQADPTLQEFDELIGLPPVDPADVPEPVGPPLWPEWDTEIHGEVTFFQLSWMASPEEALYPYSNVGMVEFTFSEGAGDWLLDQYDGGYLNVVIDTTAAGGTDQWAVQNLYLTYKNLDFLLDSTPSVQFSLGLDGETLIESLEAAVLLSDELLKESPVVKEEHFESFKVSIMPYLVGGLFGGGSAMSDIPKIIGPWIGPLVPPVETHSIAVTGAYIPPIEEGHMGCAPGAAARSISYLGQVHDFPTPSPQDIYNNLVRRMKTDICGEGTVIRNMRDGKNSYSVAKGFPIGPSRLVDWNNNIPMVTDALAAGCNVEIFIGWSKGGGHAAMVTKVSVHADGSTTIHYVDDCQDTQGAQNWHRVIRTDPAGNFRDGEVWGFMIQCAL